MTEESLLGLLKENSPQVVAVFFGTLNALSDGMHFGWTAPTIPILQREDSPIKITSDDVMMLEVLYMAFGVVGLPITVFLVDGIGRKNSVLFASTVSLIGWILISLADRVEYLIVARCLVGAAADIAFVCSPMYIAEIAHQKIRGFLAGIIYAMVLGGILVIYSIAPYVSIGVPPIVGVCVLLTQLIVFPFMPESPYYYLYKNRETDAINSLRRLRGRDDVDDEIEQMAAAIQRQKLEKGRLIDLILIRSNRKAVFVMTLLNAVQHMVGFSAITMNLHTILNAAGATYLDSDLSAIMFAAVMLIASMGSMLVVDKIGRKLLYGISCFFCGISLLIIAVFFTMKYSESDVLDIAWIPLAFTMTFAAFFKFGVGVIPIIMTAELFPARVKAYGMALADGIYVIFASISLYVFQAIYESYGLHYVFYLFAAVSFIGLIFDVFFIPETKGKTLEEIQMLLKNDVTWRTNM